MKKSRANPKKCGIEKRPVRMLKEFLRDEEFHNSNSSSGFKSFPRSQLPPHSDPPPATLPRSRSRSRAAAEAAVSSFQKLLHSAVKSLHSFTKKDKKPANCDGKVKVKVKVKDILRWKSFRDVADENKSQPLDSVGSTTTTASSGSAGGTVSSEGSRSSWADNQFSFTVDELPCWWVNDNDKNGKSVKEEGRIKMWKEDHHVDRGDPDSVRGITDTTDSAPPLMDPLPQDQITNEEDKEQNSPVSVLNSPFRDEISDDELVSAFDQSLANVERTKQRLLQSLQWFESLAGVDDQSSVEEDDIERELVEEEERQKREDSIAREELKSRVYLIKGQGKLKRAGQSLKDKEACIKVVEGQGQWSKFGEETEEIGVDLEVGLLHDLVDEALLDLFGSPKLV